MRHFAAAEAQGHFDLVALVEESPHRAHLHLVIVIVDHRPEFDFLDLDDFLLFSGFGRFLLRLIFVLADIQNLADGRIGIRGDLHEIEPGLNRFLKGALDIDDAVIGSVLVDQLYLADADLLVNARAVLLNGRRGSHRTTNGMVSLCCYNRPEDQEKPLISQRR